MSREHLKKGEREREREREQVNTPQAFFHAPLLSPGNTGPRHYKQPGYTYAALSFANVPYAVMKECRGERQ